MLGMLFFLGAMAVLGGASLAKRRAWQATTEEAFRSLGGDPRRTLGGVEGPVRGLTVHYATVAQRNRPSESICRVTLSVERPPFEMDLRPETRWGQRDVEHGRAIDLVLGDERFDESFLVEAAPADVARALLDMPTRTALLAFHPCHLTILGNELRFTKSARLDEFAEIRRVLELCTDVGSRLASLPALLHEDRLALARAGETSGYRGPSPEAIRALGTSPRSSEEIEALHRIRARRSMVRMGQAAAVVALGIIAWLFLASSHR